MLTRSDRNCGRDQADRSGVLGVAEAWTQHALRHGASASFPGTDSVRVHDLSTHASLPETCACSTVPIESRGLRFINAANPLSISSRPDWIAAGVMRTALSVCRPALAPSTNTPRGIGHGVNDSAKSKNPAPDHDESLLHYREIGLDHTSQERRCWRGPPLRHRLLMQAAMVVARPSR